MSVVTQKIFLRLAQGFLKRSVGHLHVRDEQTTLNPYTIAIQCLQGAISFSETTRGNRQRRAWERLINYIESAASLAEFDKAAARAEGYAQALVEKKPLGREEFSSAITASRTLGWKLSGEVKAWCAFLARIFMMPWKSRYLSQTSLTGRCEQPPRLAQYLFR